MNAIALECFIWHELVVIHRAQLNMRVLVSKLLGPLFMRANLEALCYFLAAGVLVSFLLMFVMGGGIIWKHFATSCYFLEPVSC